MQTKRYFSFILLILTTLACTLIDPPSVVIPTPIPTAPPLDQTLSNANAPIVTDPVSNIVPDVDPDIEALVNAVSEQQLMAYVQTLESLAHEMHSARHRETILALEPLGDGFTMSFVRVGQASNNRLQVRFEDFPLNYKGFSANQRNIIATLPGTSPSSVDNVIVIVAHYDTRPVVDTDGVSRAPGANDNGSGIALLLETARLLSSRQWNQTIVFLAVSAEEQGTHGSRHFVQNTILNGTNVLATINYDGVGGEVGIPQSIRLFSADFLNSPTGQLGRYYDYIAGLYVPTFPVDVIDALDREDRWGDHREFVYAGMPAIRLTQSIENPDLLNSTRDTWSAIDYTYLRQITQMNVAVIGNMAGSPPQPIPPTIVNMANPGTYLLTWPVDPVAAGYVISFRPLNSPAYPTFRFVNANEAGNVALTGIDPSITYAVSMAGLDANGRMGIFSPEVVIQIPESTQ